MKYYDYDLELKQDMLPKLVRESSHKYKAVESFQHPQEIRDFVCRIYKLNQKAEEYVYAIAVDNKNCTISVFLLSKGTVNASLISPREIMIRMLLSGASGFFLVHNHPGGNPSPGKEDIRITRRIKQAGSLIGIELLDHIIAGHRNHCFSFKENKVSLD